MSITLKPFHMIRHGQSTANAAHVFAGLTDVELSDLGKEEAHFAKDKYTEHPNKPSIVIHSKLARARQTAEIINEALNLEIVEHAGIHEQDFGDWENQPVEKFIDCYLTRETPLNGESFDVFELRIKEALNDILAKHENPLIVCHGGVFRAFKFIYDQGRFPVDNAIPYEFEPMADNHDFPWKISQIMQKP